MRVDVFDKYEFFTGVPDSQLKPLCDWLHTAKGDSGKHVIAANEGNAVAIAAGYYLATGKIPVVYMQNSGIGNAVNPIVSLTSPEVFGIPMLFVIGWRGEPGVHDEPQHMFQGKITPRLLDILGIASHVIDENTDEKQFHDMEAGFEREFAKGKSAAFIIRKNALRYDGKIDYSNDNALSREDAIKFILEVSKDDAIISTTGKASRELYEIRDDRREGHSRDFLTVGSMGHSSSIALGFAMRRPERRVWIIDGDGAAIMHLGAMATIGASARENMVHVVVNNAAHESVGGMPTVACAIDFCRIADGLGYQMTRSAYDMRSLGSALHNIHDAKCLCFLEVKTAVGSRDDLGRPGISPKSNMRQFMQL